MLLDLQILILNNKSPHLHTHQRGYTRITEAGQSCPDGALQVKSGDWHWFHTGQLLLSVSAAALTDKQHMSVLQDCQICDWPMLDIIIIIIIRSGSIISLSVWSIMSEMTWETVTVLGLLLHKDKQGRCQLWMRCCQAKADRRDIVLTGCAVFVSIIQLSASLHIWIMDNKMKRISNF